MLATESVGSVAQSVLSTLFEWDSQIVEDATWNPADRTYAGSVHITGTWNGAVILNCSESVTHDAAAHMFSVDFPSDTGHFVEDTVAELVNMVGGNLKALLSEGVCSLSLPTVSSGSHLRVCIPESDQLDQATVQCKSGLLVITVLERRPVL